MHRLLPEFIQEKYLAEETTGTFLATGLFVDISGFTAMTEVLMGHGQDGAEALAQLIRNVFDPLVENIFEQGGFVSNLAGDAFTAIFPANNTPDTLRDDSILHALAAAWNLQQLMMSSPRFHTAYGEFTVSIRVGVAVGEVSWGILSSSNKHRAAYYFQGPAIDGCTEAQQLGQAGDVVVDAAVFAALGSAISAEPVKDHFRITAINQVLPEPEPFSLTPVDPDVVSLFFPLEDMQQMLSGEFRQVVSMFVSLPTVRMANQLRIFMQTVFSLQDSYGGLLNRLDFGDKGASLLLFWGAPVTYENDATRALSFILDLQAQTAIPVNAGITYEIAHAGYCGSRWAGEYTCHGRGTSLSARMMQAAPRGEIWVDENLAERIQARFEVDLEGDVAFKGFAQKQRVFVLLERKEAAKQIYASEMVGRLDELKMLTDFLQPIWAGQHPGIMVVWGEAGIGKSRLVHGFLQHLELAANHTYSIFVCQTDEILRESLNPFRYWLRTYFGQSSQQSDARNKRSFNRKFDQLIASTSDETLAWELDRTRSFLGSMVNLHWPDSLYEQLDAKGRYENSLGGLLSLLKAESLQQPVILFLEDIQWLDQDSVDFLARLEQGLTQELSYSIGVVATGRPQRTSTLLSDLQGLHEIHLHEMARSDLATLAASQLGAPIGSGLLALLVERTDGNPFFAEQILRYLREQGLAALVDGEWQLQAVENEVLPTDVRSILVQRLDQLTNEVKEVVQTASVLGREFEIKLLAHMLKDDPAIREKVAQAEHLSIWVALNELRYLFRHALLRDAAYHMQGRTRREALHRLAAEAIEDLHDDLSPYYGELAHHTEQARQIEKARLYLELAGEAAQAAYQNTLANDYFGRALGLTPDADLECRYRLLKAREELHFQLGGRQEQTRHLMLMEEMAYKLQDVGKKIEVLIRQAWLSFWLSDFQQTSEWAQQAVTLAGASGEHGLAIQARYAMAWAKLQQCDYAVARTQAEAMLTAARRTDDLRGQGNGHNILGMISIAEGDYYQSRDHLKSFLTIAREIKDRERECAALVNLGVVSMPLGDYDAAQLAFAQFMGIAREMGNRSGTGSAFINLSWVATAQEKWEEAIEFAEAGIANKLETKHGEGEAEGLLWLGHAWSGLNQPVKALEAYRKSIETRRELGQEHLVMEVLAGMARTALAQNDLDTATSYVTEILSYLDSGGSLDGTWEPSRIYLTCYLVLQAADDTRANALLETAYQWLQEQASKIPDAAVCRMFLEDVPWHRDIVMAYRRANE